MNIVPFLFLILIAGAFGRKGFGDTEQEWGFVDVRPGAHMFWWLYYTTATVNQPSDKPLVIWLQGGPGASSTGYGNFEEIGPLDVNLNPRNTTWIKTVNVLFIDNPVGTGFSYVDKINLLSTTNAQIAKDLTALLKAFYQKLPAFKKTPLYIAAESYGGKMTVDFALEIEKEVAAGNLDANLKGVALVDSWISPIDSVLTWAPYLYHTGLVDDNGYKAIDDSAQSCKKALDNGQYVLATNLWSETEGVIIQQTQGVDFYNILLKIQGAYSTLFRKFDDMELTENNKIELMYRRHFGPAVYYSLDSIMNGPVREALNISKSIQWNDQSGAVFTALLADFMKPVVSSVEQLLNSTNVKVYVISGQLDLIVDTPGTYLWAKRAQFKYSKEWNATVKKALIVNGYIEGYVKKYKNFGFYWVDRAGHMVPADNPLTMNAILDDLIAS